MSAEQELLRATIRRFCERELRSWSGDADREAQAPEALFRLGQELGLFVDAVPESAGGLMDAPFEHLGRALRGLELGRGCAGMAQLLEGNVEPALALQSWGSPGLQEQVFAQVAEGALLCLGHDFRGVLRLGDVQAPVLEGALGPIPGGALAQYLLLLARQEDGQGVVALVPRSAAQVESVTPSGWRAGAWATWRFAGAALDPEHVLVRGEVRAAHEEILAWANTSLAARALGVATAAMEYAEAYGAERVQFQQAIGEFESIVRMRDRSETAIAACRLLVLQAASLLDRGESEAFELASRARDLSSEIVTRATIDAVQIYGGYGFVNDYPVEKLMRDARAFEVLHGNEAFARVLRRNQREC